MNENESKKAEKAEIKFKYKFDKNYNPVYCNGVFGGLAPCGEIVMNFYQERPGVPHEQVELVDESGLKTELREKRLPKDRPNFIRFVENGVIMNEMTARAIHQWLGDKIKNLESLRNNGTINEDN